jgi:hypothetical protein
METQRKTDTGYLRPSARTKTFSLRSNINLIQESILRLMRFYASLDLSMSSSGRRYFLLTFSLLLISLVAGSNPRGVGDGAEYLAMTLNLSEFHLPAPSPKEFAHLQERLAQLGKGYAGISITYPNLVAKDGRQDFPHFWLYSALAALWVWVTRALDLHPNFSFTIVNTTLMALALGVVTKRLHWATTLLLFGSPILWWIDKGHTEVFTFSLLAIAFALLREQPWWSLVCLGVASTQNPPIALVLPIVAVMTLITRPGALRDNRFRVGIIAGATFASLPSLYYLARLGITTPLLRASGGPRLRVPTLDELGAVIWDPNIGILPAFPAWTVVLLGVGVAFIARACKRLKASKTDAESRCEKGAYIARARRRLKAPGVWVAILTTGIFLVSFAQITNINNGGTPSISRYGLWLIPLAIPLLQEADTAFSQKLRLWLAPVAIASLVWCIFMFHPNLSENSLTPTRLASFLWTRYPSLNNPLADVFFERISHAEQALFPIATATCSKILLVGGLWPATCLPEGDIPAHCMDPEALCYANRTPQGYKFVEAPGSSYVIIKGEPVYPIGERISFAQGGTGYKYTGPGWFGAESWGAWTERSTAVVMLKLLDIPNRDLVLSIEGQAFLTDKNPVQSIEVLVNRHYVETLRYTFPSGIDTRVITISKSLVQEKNGLLIIEFKMKSPKSPAELGLSTDARLLGLALVSLRLDEMKP